MSTMDMSVQLVAVYKSLCYVLVSVTAYGVFNLSVIAC
jgi:hypothetical protein